MHHKQTARLVFIGALLATQTLLAGAVTIVDATLRSLGDDRYRINVTLQHADTGWDHYANRWDVLDESGELLGSRTLHHPHVEEQPFTRSLTLNIPASVKTVRIVANDSVHGLGEAAFELRVADE